MGNARSNPTTRLRDLIDRAREEYPYGMTPIGPAGEGGENPSNYHAFEVLVSPSFPVTKELMVSLAYYVQTRADWHRNYLDEKLHKLTWRRWKRLLEKISDQNKRVKTSGEEPTVYILYIQKFPTDQLYGRYQVSHDG